jgi:hypothetical protein
MKRILRQLSVVLLVFAAVAVSTIQAQAPVAAMVSPFGLSPL